MTTIVRSSQTVKGTPFVGSLMGNATSAATFSGSLVGDVTGGQTTTSVAAVGGKTALQVANATAMGNAATSLASVSTLVRRDASGNFAAGTLTATLQGHAITATASGSFSGTLAGDVSGGQSSTLVDFVGGATAANVATATGYALAATHLATPSTVVKRDGLGNFSAGTVVGALVGNASTCTTTAAFSGSLVGDATGTQGATVISTVGGKTAAEVATATSLLNASTSTNTPLTVVRGDGAGGFSAGTITAALSGNASTSTSSPTFTGSFAGNVTGTQGTTVVSVVGGETAASVATATTAAANATSANTLSTIVRRDASGNFAAGTVTASLSGNATTCTTSTTANALATTGAAVSISASTAPTVGQTLVATSATTATWQYPAEALISSATNSVTNPVRDPGVAFGTPVITVPSPSGTFLACFSAVFACSDVGSIVTVKIYLNGATNAAWTNSVMIQVANFYMPMDVQAVFSATAGHSVQVYWYSDLGTPVTNERNLVLTRLQ